MKAKPDIHAAQRDFLLRAGAGAGLAASADSVRITKTIRIDRAVDLAIKHAALERTGTGGGRVTESDIIEQAVRQYLNL
jgi:hypothetical protein